MELVDKRVLETRALMACEFESHDQHFCLVLEMRGLESSSLILSKSGNRQERQNSKNFAKFTNFTRSVA